MATRVCRILPFREADGPEQMACDEALLETAATLGLASLRFYSWSVPTVSLGYFQPHAVRSTKPLLASCPWVRRATGGATLVHHHEVTYALALPPGPEWQPRTNPWLKRMHRILVAALARLGIEAYLCGDDQEKKLGDVLCFLHHTPGDILCSGCKVVGSAQRKQRGALLQHGGILLAQSVHTPELPGLKELSGRSPTRTELCGPIIETFMEQTGWDVDDDYLTPLERRRSATIAEARYRNSAWNEKR